MLRIRSSMIIQTLFIFRVVWQIAPCPMTSAVSFLQHTKINPVCLSFYNASFLYHTRFSLMSAIVCAVCTKLITGMFDRKSVRLKAHTISVQRVQYFPITPQNEQNDRPLCYLGNAFYFIFSSSHLYYRNTQFLFWQCHLT